MSKVYVFTAFGGPETQRLIDRPVPEPGPGELAVQVRAAGVNPVDWKIRSGRYGKQTPLPAPMGQEVAGVVTVVGDGVDGFAVGEPILGPVVPGYGAFAEDTLVRAAEAMAKPAEISFTDAATIPVAAATAYDGTHQIELEPGQRLLILGAGGGVGLMAAQIGKVHQLTAIGVASPAKREVVESTGATFVPSGDGVSDRVRQVAPGGVDLILDLVGGDALREVAGLVDDPTRIISAADPGTATELGGTALHRTAEAMEKITAVIEYHLVDPHVSAVYSLQDAGEAIGAVENGHATGKIVIEVPGA
ncbi:NADP-dependent oxidoreductase [Georgenia sp. TF02-10]|uniref:NADP-dependent oxidoreductase n=1 Tax=Georgenia sp. TF02-10 TaxID=2917725 RepID=UPI001FA714F0|nr:NADP-dependent oxidoreductase [Georgenia sp. TF02-10]UNX54395.1 NADP-dependent oxidoreductase [Georgenia sp. TF02-10]